MAGFGMVIKKRIWEKTFIEDVRFGGHVVDDFNAPNELSSISMESYLFSYWA